MIDPCPNRSAVHREASVITITEPRIRFQIGKTTTGAKARNLLTRNAALKGPLFHGRASAKERNDQDLWRPPRSSAAPWKSGASAPRPALEKGTGLQPRGWLVGTRSLRFRLATPVPNRKPPLIPRGSLVLNNEQNPSPVPNFPSTSRTRRNGIFPQASDPVGRMLVD